ncbi:hypothetical protein BGY98DRAFT_965405 [Russula aff. rugulosa BPL654]|nr:hypothetical protein BGY98DRAFT_965405 [Russula aff. rugulosa BPL654]
MYRRILIRRAPGPRSPFNLFLKATLLLNSTLATALTLISPGLKRDGGPRLSDLKGRAPRRLLAFVISQTGTSSGKAARHFALLRNRVWLHRHRSNQFRKIVCRRVSEM